MFGAVLLMFPWMMLVSLLPTGGAYGVYPQDALMVIWFVGIICLAIKWQSFRCPRCGEPYFRKLLYGNAFAQKCMHCKLEKFSNG